MRIISYNVAKCTQEKINHILNMDADLYIIPECGNDEYVSLPEEYVMLWTGDDDIPYKGLGVIYKKTLDVRIIPVHKKIKHHLPIIVNDETNPFFVLACWPTVWKEQKTYPQLLLEMQHEYEIYFSKYPSLAIGDFNCYIGQNGVNKKTGTFQDCIQKFKDMGMNSLYHQGTGENFGKESEATFFWRFKESSPYFIDYAFSSIKTKSYAIGKWEKNQRPLFANHRTINTFYMQAAYYCRYSIMVCAFSVFILFNILPGIL